jgi:hypothetical protein
MKALHFARIIDMTGAQKIRWTPADLVPRPALTPALLAEAPLDAAE